MRKTLLLIVLISGLFGENNPSNRQGGDTFANATEINALPFSDSGTTTGYINDLPFAIESLDEYNICNWQGPVVSEPPPPTWYGPWI